MLCTGLAHHECSFEADVHRGVPGRFRQYLQLAGHDLHGVVDEDVDATVFLNRYINQLLHIRRFGDVGDHGEAPRAERGRVLYGGVGGHRVDVVDHHVGAFFGVS